MGARGCLPDLDGNFQKLPERFQSLFRMGWEAAVNPRDGELHVCIRGQRLSPFALQLVRRVVVPRLLSVRV